MTVSELAELSNMSKAYISQVKNGKRTISPKLIYAVLPIIRSSEPAVDYVSLFLQSRRDGISPKTILFYKSILYAADKIAKPATSPYKVNAYIKALNGSAGNKHAHYRALRAFFGWLYSPKSGMGLKQQDNPMLYVDAPNVPKSIPPSLTREEVEVLVNKADNSRDKAIIALLTESGLRHSELTNIQPSDIDWINQIIRVIGKGNKEGYAPFGSLSEQYLKEWLSVFEPNGNNIWGLNYWGISSMLRRLEDETGLPCNPHTFRRTFACLLRKAGVDTMTIKDLGRWESLEMVQRYTRSVTFHDSLKLYKAPLS